jgi:predicted ATPase
MNDVTFLEASRRLAEKIMTNPAGVAYGFRLVTGRAATGDELTVLLSALERHRATYEKDESAARNLLAHGDARRNTALPVADLAAHTLVASLLLNLDEGITKE